MNLLYISKYQFKKQDGKTFALPAFGAGFWEKYLDVFDRLEILAEDVKKYLDNGTLSEIVDERISVEILPRNTAPSEFVNDRAVKARLEERIKQADAILIKPSSRKGIMAIELAEKYHKPYMIELTGDLSLTLRNHPNILKRMYNPYLHRRILRAIKNCEFGLYVTEEHLQQVYPISGKQCGCTDTVLPYISESVLTERLEKIAAMDEQDEIKIGMVATYHDTRKGLDTAIKALKRIRDPRVVLHVLGIGTQEDRNRWHIYAKRHGVEDRLKFDTPVAGVEKVFRWNDQMDLCILPSRSEGLPRCVVESISRACPCVVSNVCGLPELVEKRWTHEPGDDRTLANRITELLADSQLMRQTAIHNFNHSKKYAFAVLKQKRDAFLEGFRQYCRDREEQE